jgi:hypothetical protein
MIEFKKFTKKNYIVVANHSIQEDEFNFDLFLYLTTIHLRTQSRSKVNYFHLYRKGNLLPIAIFQCIIISDRTCQSAPSAPFGSIQCQDDCSPEEIDVFVKSIVAHITAKGGRELHINHYANCYAHHASLISDIYLRNGFRCSKSVTNQHIPVSDQSFLELIRPAEHRRLKKCQRAGFKSQRDGHTDPSILYHFLSYCRAAKDYQLSMDQCQLELLLTTFPTQVQIFTVTQLEKIIAGAVIIRVNKKICYYFLADSLPEYKAYSPMVMLIGCVYQYCRQEEIRILDLGTSLDQHGAEKSSLIRFKENVGGVRSQKNSFRKKLS